MSNPPEESALVRPFRKIVSVLGFVFDTLYYFVESLILPGSTGRIIEQQRRSARAIGTIHPSGSGGNAPNMSVGGCRSCM